MAGEDGFWHTLATAGGGGSGGLLGYAQYDPATVGVFGTTNASTFTDVSAAILVASFTVPNSGRVLVRLSADARHGTTSGGGMFWNLRDSAGDVTGSDGIVSYLNGSGSRFRANYSVIITGLTAGDVLTWKWGWKSNDGDMFVGGANGPAVMEVLAA